MIDSNSTTQESYDMVVNRTARTWLGGGGPGLLSLSFRVNSKCK
jgi:hypothetical protein